jgi:lysophospholipase L1-like esterase
MTKNINIKLIRIDGGTQSRVALNQDVVSDYRDALARGDLPPVVLFFDGSDHWLADGFHRFHAYRTAGKASIPADVRSGTKRDAMLFSFGANGAHGLRRTNDDKRKAVSAMLADAEWSALSDRQIAIHCAVTQPFVSGLRKPKVITVITPEANKVSTVDSPPLETTLVKGVATVATPAPSKVESDSTDADPELDNLRDSVRVLAEDNDRLMQRLAVEAMDASEEEKTAAAELIAQLRAEVKQLRAENSGLKSMRDSLQVENGVLKQQCQSLLRKLRKLETPA